MNNNKRRVYIDGIWDLFHFGHLENLKDLKYLDNEDNYLIVGIVSDQDAISYKRKPIIEENHRIEIIKSIKYVDEVIEKAPLIVTEEFMNLYNIDLVCHGFLEKEDFEKQKTFFVEPIRLNKFREVSYHYGISTSTIISKIKNL